MCELLRSHYISSSSSSLAVTIRTSCWWPIHETAVPLLLRWSLINPQCFQLRCIKDRHSAAGPSCYVLCLIDYIAVAFVNWLHVTKSCVILLCMLLLLIRKPCTGSSSNAPMKETEQLLAIVLRRPILLLLTNGTLNSSQFLEERHSQRCEKHFCLTLSRQFFDEAELKPQSLWWDCQIHWIEMINVNIAKLNCFPM